MMTYELKSITRLNVKCIDYRFAIWNMTRNDASNRLYNSRFDNKGSLLI